MLVPSGRCFFSNPICGSREPTQENRFYKGVSKNSYGVVKKK